MRPDNSFLKITVDEVKLAYLNLKNHIYNDKYGHFNRLNIAKFEDENKVNLEKKFLEIIKILNCEDQLDKYIEKVDFYFLPKNFSNKDINNEQIITNRFKRNEYIVEDFNCFINAPIELLIIDVLWIKYVGYLLEYNYCHFSDDFKDYNYAYKLNFNNNAKKTKLKLEFNENTNELFKTYHVQYQKWIKDALDAQEILYKEKKKDSFILSMDIKGYYYSIDLDYDNNIGLFKELQDKRDNIKNESTLIRNQTFRNLNKYLEKIHSKYREKVKAYKQINNNFIPIGLLSSGIIANWYLKEFDNNIISKTHPDFYGRYVDDILLVYENKLPCTNKLCGNCFKDKPLCIKGIINTYFKDIIVEKDEDNIEQNKSYKLSGYEHLFIQSKKIKIFEIDADSSKAVIEKFRKTIRANSSEYRFLPEEEEIEQTFIDKAYQVNYNGSINKIRNIDKYIQDKHATSIALAKKINIAQYCEYSSVEEINNLSSTILDYFSGIISLQLFELWEKALTYYMFVNSQKYYSLFVKESIGYIKKIIFKNKEYIDSELNDVISIKLQKDLIQYLIISISLSASLNPKFLNEVKYLSIDDDEFSKVKNNIYLFRSTNLIKHNYLFLRLITITKLYEINNEKSRNEISGYIDLIKKDLFIYKNYKEKDSDIDLLFKEDYHLDNYLPFYKTSHDMQIIEYFKAIDKISNDTENNDRLNSLEYIEENIPSLKTCNNNPKFNVIKFDPLQNTGYLNIGLPNLPLNKKTRDFRDNILGKYDLSYKKYKKIKKLIDEARKENCDLLIMPEVSIPPHWLSLLMRESKKQDKELGIICGLEHWTNINGYTFNFIAHILPYKYKVDEHKYNSSLLRLRLKKEYAPEEEKLITQCKCNIPTKKQEKEKYDLIEWNNVRFNSFNCFEFADISDRAAFKSKVDLLVSIEYNPDVEYYTNISKSTVRDLHCYILEANDAEFGGSNIYAPKKDYKINPLSIRGGINASLVTYKLEIKELKEFQYTYNKLTYNSDKNELKPLPPKFESKSNERIEPSNWMY